MAFKLQTAVVDKCFRPGVKICLGRKSRNSRLMKSLNTGCLNNVPPLLDHRCRGTFGTGRLVAARPGGSFDNWTAEVKEDL